MLAGVGALRHLYLLQVPSSAGEHKSMALSCCTLGLAIRMARGNQSQAARWLGVSLPTMREKLLKYGLHPKTDT